MDVDIKLPVASQWIPRRLKPVKLDPKKCVNARPYVLDKEVINKICT
jgi:hypothetical protein